MKIFHRHLGAVKITDQTLQFQSTQDSAFVENEEGKIIEVSKHFLAFSPFVDYPKPRICVIVDGGTAQVFSSDSFMDVEVIDFDALKLSTAEKEQIFSDKLNQYKHTL